jgi:hypothetical protein
MFYAWSLLNCFPMFYAWIHLVSVKHPDDKCYVRVSTNLSIHNAFDSGSIWYLLHLIFLILILGTLMILKLITLDYGAGKTLYRCISYLFSMFLCMSYVRVIIPLFLFLWISIPNIGGVGTLNQGYPLLQYEDTVPVQLSLTAWWTAPDSTTWAAPRTARGQKRWYTPGCHQWVRTSMRERQTPVHSTRTSEYGPGLPSKQAGPLGWDPNPSEWGPDHLQQSPGTGNTLAYVKDRQESGTDTCPGFGLCASAPRSGKGLMLPCGLSPVT